MFNENSFTAQFDYFTKILIKGIDYATLRKQLSNGMRLNHPNLATPNVCHILQTCWLPEPSARPTFSKILQYLLEDEQFPRDLLNNVKGLNHSSKEDVSKMVKQYRSIQECNPMFENIHNLHERRVHSFSIAGTSENTIYPKSIETNDDNSRVSSALMSDPPRGYLIPLFSTTTTMSSCGDDDTSLELKHLAEIHEDVFDT